ncbi:hypothetical protein F4677DRAFT_463035 [Hypoxylon crocopeplum]|nr:hypothetical protein F4677DRAFT_463035 [Hypoxylon crocopeplum]
MAPNPRTVKVPDADWVRRKDAILDLYLSTESTLQEITNRMRHDRGFSATIAQYEAQLRAWGARRNLKLQEWRPILEEIDNLPPGIESRVKLSGRCIPKRRIQRARRHCKNKSANAQHNQSNDGIANDESTDAFIEVCDSSGVWRRLGTAVEVTPTSCPSRRSSEAPGVLIQSQSIATFDQIYNAEEDHQVEQNDNSTGDSFAGILNDLEAPDNLMFTRFDANISGNSNWDVYLQQSNSPISWSWESSASTVHMIPDKPRPATPNFSLLEYSIPRCLGTFHFSNAPFEWLKGLSFGKFEDDLTSLAANYAKHGMRADGMHLANAT